MEEDVKIKILELLNSQVIGVLSTARAAGLGPESAVVDYIATDALSIVFGTSPKSRKYANIKTNPHVSFVVGFEVKTGSIQYEGIARELSREEAMGYSPALASHNQAWFIINPTWIRLLHKSGQRYEVTI